MAIENWSSLASVTFNEPARLTATQLRAAREWVKECSWAESYEPQDIDRLPAWVIERGIARHYCGGLAGFIRDCD